MRLLSGDDLKELLKPEIAVAAVKRAFISLYEKKVVQVPRLVLSVSNNWWGFMISHTEEYLVTKIVNVIEENKKRNLPSVQGIVVLLDVKDGRPLAIMDGTVLTAIRTSAASILSTEIALGKRNIGTLGIIGAGMEAEYHAILAQEYFKINKLLITARKNHYKLAQKVGGEAVELEKLLRESDVIFSTTASTT
ncbi:MAG: ornithine cyclodeaminase family protein, partial [Sulfolobaceae archaeon]